FSFLPWRRTTTFRVRLSTSIPATFIVLVPPVLLYYHCPLGSPTLHILACRPCQCRLKSGCSRPQILFGMGEEGGEPLYVQARSFRVGRLPLGVTPFYLPGHPLHHAPRTGSNTNIQGWAMPTMHRSPEAFLQSAFASVSTTHQSTPHLDRPAAGE